MIVTHPFADPRNLSLKTLPDLVDRHLRILSVGINPSLRAVREGFYFPNPRNRFWRALNNSGLLDEPLIPSPEAMRTLLERYRIGFTDLVKRPSSMASELKTADYREAAPKLATMIVDLEPELVWFHGKTVLDNYLKYTGAAASRTEWGLQPVSIGPSRLYVTPNPSAANARFSLGELTTWYAGLAKWL